MTGRYDTPAAFKQALKARVKQRAKTAGRGFNQMLQVVLFERFLARVYEALGDSVILKGGFALELRLARARTTRDVDLRIDGDIEKHLDELRRVAGRQGQDYLRFDLGDPVDFEEMLGEQVVYEGRRLKVRTLLAGQSFGHPFRLDVSVGDRLVLPPDIVPGTDLFEFVGLVPVNHRLYPPAAHLAEKLHALTTVYEAGPNSRSRDLVDIGLLAKSTSFDADSLRRSIEATFQFRDTHSIPESLPTPPEFWHRLYANMRDTNELPWPDLDALQQFCTQFFDPLLDGTVADNHAWSPEEQSWQ